jgi:DNA-directed RNA polymerase omega subunit
MEPSAQLVFDEPPGSISGDDRAAHALETMRKWSPSITSASRIAWGRGSVIDKHHTLNDVAERAVERVGSKFELVGAIVQRAHQLSQGYPPLVTGVDLDKTATTALREIAAGVVEVNQGGTKRHTPERDELAA